jgi:hypothetical protein
MERKKKKNVFLASVIIVSILLLNGCCYVCPPVNLEMSTTDKTKCEVLGALRKVTSETDHRFVKDKLYKLPNLEDAMRIFNDFEICQVDVFSAFHFIHPDIPFGYIEYPDGMKTHITMVYNDVDDEMEVYKVYKDKMVRMYDNPYVVKAVIS